MKIPCHFCQTELEANKIASTMYQAFCHTCPETTSTMYSMGADGKLKFWSAGISFEDRGKEYKAYYCDKFFRIDMVEPFTDMNGNIITKQVVQLSFCPKNITPYNIREKFQTLRVWS